MNKQQSGHLQEALFHLEEARSFIEIALNGTDAGEFYSTDIESIIEDIRTVHYTQEAIT